MHSSFEQSHQPHHHHPLHHHHSHSQEHYHSHQESSCLPLNILTKPNTQISKQMLKPPKIVITNIDEDPAIKRQRRRRKIAEYVALASILLVNWIMVIGKSCFVFGMLSGVITTLITVMQYCIMLQTHYGVRFGPKQASKHYREPMSVVQSARRILANMFKCTCVRHKMAILPN